MISRCYNTSSTFTIHVQTFVDQNPGTDELSTPIEKPVAMGVHLPNQSMPGGGSSIQNMIFHDISISFIGFDPSLHFDHFANPNNP